MTKCIDGAAAEAYERLAASVDENIDWEALEAARERDEALVGERDMGVVRDSVNVYHLPNGRVVDAHASLYHPRTFAEDPAKFVTDFPTEEQD